MNKLVWPQLESDECRIIQSRLWFIVSRPKKHQCSFTLKKKIKESQTCCKTGKFGVEPPTEHSVV